MHPDIGSMAVLLVASLPIDFVLAPPGRALLQEEGGYRTLVACMTRSEKARGLGGVKPVSRAWPPIPGTATRVGTRHFSRFTGILIDALHLRWLEGLTRHLHCCAH